MPLMRSDSSNHEMSKGPPWTSTTMMRAEVVNQKQPETDSHRGERDKGGHRGEGSITAHNKSRSESTMVEEAVESRRERQAQAFEGEGGSHRGREGGRGTGQASAGFSTDQEADIQDVEEQQRKGKGMGASPAQDISVPAFRVSAAPSAMLLQATRNPSLSESNLGFAH
ncbi:MAG: hypothetical protein FRX49_04596 [Trebouxia sp. A1-2]|nr:MAG: hypothetical protein FRX49_04596 [Trebouxia sp. A1-2]